MIGTLGSLGDEFRDLPGDQRRVAGPKATAPIVVTAMASVAMVVSGPAIVPGTTTGTVRDVDVRLGSRISSW